MADTRKKKKKRLSRGAVIVIAAALFAAGFFSVRALLLMRTEREYAERESELAAAVERESQRAEELSQEELFAQTRLFIEQTAREKFGLINPGEMVVRPE